MTYKLLLDTSSLMYRAFFALPPSIADQHGQPINAVHGYLDMTTRLLTTYRPHELIHVYDAAAYGITGPVKRLPAIMQPQSQPNLKG